MTYIIGRGRYGRETYPSVGGPSRQSRFITFDFLAVAGPLDGPGDYPMRTRGVVSDITFESPARLVAVLGSHTLDGLNDDASVTLRVRRDGTSVWEFGPETDAAQTFELESILFPAGAVLTARGIISGDLTAGHNMSVVLSFELFGGP